MGDEDTPPEGQLPLRSLPLAQREVALLVVLCVITAAMFVGTRRLAAWSHGRRAATAAQWFARGEQLTKAGDRDQGIAALREAVAADRQNVQYTLALARSLDDAGHDDEARQLLLLLRQRQPDDVEVNYRLAGLAALYGDAPEAIRYYNYAMYGLARIGRDYERREIREELIALLIDRGDLQEAATQLASLSRELPDTAAAQIQAARLADRAGDSSRALQFYGRASALDPKNADAAAGAGEAAYVLHDFRSAVRELERAVALGASSPTLESRLIIARLVLASDPLAARVASTERVRRVLAGLTRAAGRHDLCQQTLRVDPQAPDGIRDELAQFRRMPRSALQDQDTLSAAVAAIGTALNDVNARCPSLVEPTDQAWLLIAGMHAGGAS
jgi:tetratricopeptide (TPR) repeat protein